MAGPVGPLGTCVGNPQHPLLPISVQFFFPLFSGFFHFSDSQGKSTASSQFLSVSDTREMLQVSLSMFTFLPLFYLTERYLRSSSHGQQCKHSIKSLHLFTHASVNSVCTEVPLSRQVLELEKYADYTGHYLHRISPRVTRELTGTHLSESALGCNDTKTALRCCRTAGCCYDSGHFQGRVIKSLERKKAGEEQKGMQRSTEIKLGQRGTLDR